MGARSTCTCCAQTRSSQTTTRSLTFWSPNEPEYCHALTKWICIVIWSIYIKLPYTGLVILGSRCQCFNSSDSWPITSPNDTFLVPKDCHHMLACRPFCFHFHLWMLAFFYPMLSHLLGWCSIVVHCNLIPSDYLIQCVLTILVVEYQKLQGRTHAFHWVVINQTVKYPPTAKFS